MGAEKPIFKILIVDDNPDDVMLYERILKHDPDADYHLSSVEMGEDGVEQYRLIQPDAVLLDYNLPDLDGIEFMRKLVEESGSNCHPVVMLTGQGNEAVAVEAMKCGVRDYLIKGDITPESLRRSVINVIEKVLLERKNHDLANQLNLVNDSLKVKNRKLSELTETAHRFVDNVAHDFRTPLTVIKEFSSIIADGLGGPVTDQQNEYLQFIITATRDLAQMVDDFLDSSKLKAGVLRVNRGPHKVDQLFKSVNSILTTRAAIKKIRLVEELQSDLPMMFVDAEKLERVIINLVINAIKFSPEGTQITLWAKATECGGIEIGITDQGPGLSQEDVAVIFDRFKQVGDIQRASTKGFGLGLNIAKELAWLNLGTINIQSKQGEGSTFSIMLPVNEPSNILRRYFARFDELIEPPLNMAVLQVKPDQSEAALEEICQFLTKICYPMDLVLKADDMGSVFVFGSTTEPELWIEKIQKARVAHAQGESADTVSSLQVSCITSVPYMQAKDSMVSCSLAQIKELKHCA